MTEAREGDPERTLRSSTVPKDEAGPGRGPRVARGTSSESGGSLVVSESTRAREAGLEGRRGVTSGADGEEVDLIVSRSVDRRVIIEGVLAGGVPLSLWAGRGRSGDAGLPVVSFAGMSIDEGAESCEVESMTLLENEAVAGGINRSSIPVGLVTLREMVPIDLRTFEFANCGMIMSSCIASCDWGAPVIPCALWGSREVTAGKVGTEKG